MSTFADEVAALRGTKSATLKDLLTHPAFSRLLAAMTVSSLGDWVGFVAVTSLVASLATGAGKGFAVGGVMTARMLPAILFGPVAGVLVDRFDRKKIMIIADIARGVMYGSMAFVRPLCRSSSCCRSSSSASRCCGPRPATRRCRTWSRGDSSRTRTRSGS